MRRGHPNVGGWRGENHRHNFRPRNPGTPHFRPSRPYGQPDTPRYLVHNPRHYRPIRPYNSGPRHANDASDRNPYRINNVRMPQESELFTRERHTPHQNQRDQDHGNYESNIYQNPEGYHINSMGDTDQRRPHRMQNTNTHNPWTNRQPTFEYTKQYYEERNSHKTPRHYNMSEEMPLPDYSGHRPPASDHYTGTTANNNNSQFAHSVDDTVDIVRKRLMNRDKQQDPTSPIQEGIMDEDLRREPGRDYQSPPREPPVKKKTPQRKQNIQVNCDKMKNKIVHQLFKMDKSKIHKLMDNPSSSSKFEYAISTLITEGQNSLNRHMRSVAEKSLYSSSSDFIQNDSNTIYEDTFMKQMQTVLDPQDTILLEDIKPLVMAELSRVLQLDDFQFEGIHNQSSCANMEPTRLDYSFDDSYNSEQLTESHTFDQSHQLQESFNYNNTDSVDSLYNKSNEDSSFESKPLFERRQKHNESHEERRSIESRVSNHSINQGGYVDMPKSPCEQPIPLFDPNTEQLSDDDYPFAELDKQYHVAVDHNFIESVSCAPSPQHSFADVSNDSFTVSSKEKNEVPYKSPTIIKYEINMQLPSASSVEIEKEIDSQLQNMANSPVKIFSSNIKTKPKTVIKSENEVSIKTETKLCNKSENENNHKLSHGTEDIIHEETNKIVKEENHDSVHNSKSVLQSNTRKRSTDQKPSHRKEKRKKRSESEGQEASKSIANMFYSSDDHKNGPKHFKKTIDKTYSDKYVKRKHTQKSKEKDTVPKTEESKKINSNTSHSILSPKNSNTQETSNKDAKLKLKHIDMFVEQPKKPGAIHLARRTTATASNVKSPDDSKPKTIIPTPPITNFYRKLSKRDISTQVVLKRRNKECQTPISKKVTRVTQTYPVTVTSKNVAINPLERMKEIDMEIQILLQEKFKLYNSIETKSKSESIDTIPSLSMRIFNVAQPEESQDSEDAIVDDFTSIPTEELEKIAMETFEKSPPKQKRGRPQKVLKLARKTSESPTTKRNKKAKAPNISLIEQIITDDRPIEDIISFDDFETTPIKGKKKNQQPPKKKGMKKTKMKKLLTRYNIKPCSIVLERIDISQCLKPKQSPRDVPVNNVEFEFEVPIVGTIEKQETPTVSELKEQSELQPNVVEDDNLQFDMLDVSEDIIIGDNVEVKLDKSDERTLTEDIILDNSQSSLEEVTIETVATENECKMYDYSTNDNLRRDAITVTGNADAVLAIECIENDFIAACLDGNVYHFNGDGVLLNTLRGSNLAVTCLTIVKEKYGTTVYTGSLDSRIRYYDLETGMEKGPECNVLSPIQTMDRAWDTVFVGTRTGFVLQFECKNNMLIPVSTVKFSEQSILALRALKEGPRKVLLVAARSENVTVRDAQTGLLLRTLAGPKMTVYTLLFEDGKVYCGTSSHSIHVFDYTSGSHVGTHEGGKGAVCLRASGGLVFAGCYDGCVYVYREGESQPLAHLRGPSLMLLSLAIRGTKIIAGYKDRSLYIWKMPAAILQEMVL